MKYTSKDLMEIEGMESYFELKNNPYPKYEDLCELQDTAYDVIPTIDERRDFLKKMYGCSDEVIDEYKNLVSDAIDMCESMKVAVQERTETICKFIYDGRHDVISRHIELSLDRIASLGHNINITMTAKELVSFSEKLVNESIKRYREEFCKKEEEYLNSAEVCKYLGVTKPTLWRWAKIDYLVPIKVGVKTRYRKSDVDKIKDGK